MRPKAVFRALPVALLVVAACGGKVVVDAGGQGGDGGGATTSVTTSSSSGVDCEALGLAAGAAIDAAEACNPAIDAVQCNGSAVILDTCGCEVVANELNGQAVSDAAKQAYLAWTSAGCGPFDCDACPPPPAVGYQCDPTLSKCLPALTN